MQIQVYLVLNHLRDQNYTNWFQYFKGEIALKYHYIKQEEEKFKLVEVVSK